MMNYLFLRRVPVAFEVAIRGLSSHAVSGSRCLTGCLSRGHISPSYGRQRQGLLPEIRVSDIRMLTTTRSKLYSDRRCTVKENVKKFREQISERKKQFHDNVMTIPNALCMIRIGLTPVIGTLVVEQSFVLAVSLFTIAGVTDLLDGYIARHVKGQSSLLGSVLDPVADKLLVSTLFITLTYADLIPLALTSLVIFRDVSLIVGGFYKRFKTLVPPLTVSRFFNPSICPMRVAPTFVSKLNTTLQLSLVGLSLASPVFNFVGHPSLTALCVATGATTFISGVQYALMDRMKRVKP